MTFLGGQACISTPNDKNSSVLASSLHRSVPIRIMMGGSLDFDGFGVMMHFVSLVAPFDRMMRLDETDGDSIGVCRRLTLVEHEDLRT